MTIEMSIDGFLRGDDAAPMGIKRSLLLRFSKWSDITWCIFFVLFGGGVAMMAIGAMDVDSRNFNPYDGRDSKRKQFVHIVSAEMGMALLVIGAIFTAIFGLPFFLLVDGFLCGA